MKIQNHHLYFVPRSCAMAIYAMLVEFGIPFESTRLELAEDGLQSSQLREVSSLCKVPLLRLPNGSLISEVAAISTYLAELSGQWLPSDPALRAQVSEWISFTGTSLHPAFARFFAPQRYTTGDSAMQSVRSRGREDFERYLTIAEERLHAGESWLVGDEPSIAEPYLWVVFRWRQLIDEDISAFPKLASWYRRLSERPGFVAALSVD